MISWDTMFCGHTATLIHLQITLGCFLEEMVELRCGSQPIWSTRLQISITRPFGRFASVQFGTLVRQDLVLAFCRLHVGKTSSVDSGFLQIM